MITAAFLNQEKELSRRIYGHYLDRLIDALSVGEKNYIQLYCDCLIVNSLMKSIHSLTITEGKATCTGVEVSEPAFKQLRETMREYLNNEIRQLSYDLGGTGIGDNGSGSGDGTGGSGESSIVIISGSLGWANWNIAITQDGITEVPLPFDVSKADINSLSVTVGDHDPSPLTTADKEGCHISGSTLYWHNYYDLKAGDTIVIKYEKIA